MITTTRSHRPRRLATTLALVVALTPATLYGSAQASEWLTGQRSSPAVTLAQTADTATLSWTTRDEDQPVLVGRDGTDSSGYGEWSTTLKPGETSITFHYLIPGVTYHGYVEIAGHRTTMTFTQGRPAGATPAPPQPSAPPTNRPTPAPKPTDFATAAPLNSSEASSRPPAKANGTDATTRLLGKPPSGGRWWSGAWVGGQFTPAAIAGFGNQRGTPVDAITTYTNRASYDQISHSEWNITTFAGAPGRLVLNVAMIPDDRSATLADVAAGRHDATWSALGNLLTANGRGDAIVNIGWEANGSWWPWRANAATAADYRAAFTRIAATIKRRAPHVLIGFTIACNTALSGQNGRLDALTSLYPGDGAVDIIGGNHYDWWDAITKDEATFNQATHPPQAAGLADVADFARTHRKGFMIPEWGPAAPLPDRPTGGDNPAFIRSMRAFMEANADILVLENYFNESNPDIANSLYNPIQMPAAAAAYAELW